MKTHKFTLVGIMPLLQHADDVESADTLKAWRSDPANKNLSVAGDDRSPAWTWNTYLYTDGEAISLPSENLMVALRQAGAQLIMKRQKTFKEISQSGLLIPNEFLTFTVDGKQIPIAAIDAMREKPFAAQANAARDMGFRLFVKRARVGQSKHVRVRPRFDTWEASGTIQVLVPEITEDILHTLFELAGRIGLCDWRPGCRTPGPYGMFETKWK
jgi:hypothetical protein